MSIVISNDNQYIIKDNDKLLYVHKHYENFESNAASRYFQNKAKNKNQLLNRYKTRFLNRIKINNSTKEILNLTTAAQQEKLMNEIDKNMIEGLETAIGKASADIAQLSNDARKIMKTNNQLTALKDVFKKISMAADILNKNNGLSLLLNEYTNTNDLNGLVTELQNKLSLTNKNGEIIGFNNTALNIAGQSLLNLIVRIQSGKRLSAQSISGYFNNIFSTGLGEGIIASCIGAQIGYAGEELEQYINKTLTGSLTPNMHIKSQNDLGFKKYKELSNATNKTDFYDENMQLSINQGKDTAQIQLGLSIKTYANNKDSYAIVTNKPFKSILEALFPGGKYYVYNTLGLLDASQQQYREMKKSIILSYVDNFLSGTGYGNDFVSYMVINGKAYPVYKILQDVVNNTKGTISSDVDKTDPVSISISGASKLVKLRNEYNGNNNLGLAWLRNSAIHNIITKDLTVEAHLNTSLLTF